MARIGDLLAEKRTVSFEFFPPKTIKGAVDLSATLHALEMYQPDFYSITYGAGGSDRERTVDTVLTIQRERTAPSMAHLTCLGHTVAEVDELLDVYAAAGVENILALGGDPPKDGAPVPSGDFVHASDLVAHLRADGRFGIGVAAHPEGHPRSRDMGSDRHRLAEKLEAADFAITQFFFDLDNYCALMDELSDLGCTKPVIPGVIPITNGGQVKRFADMAGATVPASLVNRIADADSSEHVAAIGVEVATQLSRDLLDAGAPGLHFYTLNRSVATVQVLDNLATVL